jgi:DNA-binding CsgD family transcriptional regulator
MSAMSTILEGKRRLILLGLLGFCALAALEWVTEGEDLRLVDFLGDMLELALLVATAVIASLAAIAVRDERNDRLAMVSELEQAKQEGAEWRKRAEKQLDQYRQAVVEQFDEWDATEAERDVGQLILRGLSHKEIARLRNTSEATVRQQAQSLYRKANMPNKGAFSAYFLDDVLYAPPMADTDQPLRAS